MKDYEFITSLDFKFDKASKDRYGNLATLLKIWFVRPISHEEADRMAWLLGAMEVNEIIAESHLNHRGLTSMEIECWVPYTLKIRHYDPIKDGKCLALNISYIDKGIEFSEDTFSAQILFSIECEFTE